MHAVNLSPLYPSLFETADEDTYIEVEKLRSIGWEPEYSNSDALIDTYEWYKNQTEESGSGDKIGNRAPRKQLALRPFKRILQVI
jgi:hypothetical protein